MKETKYKIKFEFEKCALPDILHIEYCSGCEHIEIKNIEEEISLTLIPKNHIRKVIDALYEIADLVDREADIHDTE